MKKLLLALLLLIPITARAQSLKLGSNYSVAVSTSLNDFYVVGSYDFVNKRPLAGYGKEIVQLWKGDKELVYLSARHMFDASQNGKGQFGGALGANLGALGTQLANTSGNLSDVLPVPSWMGKAANFVSVEVGGGYWPTPNPDTKPWSWDVGGKITVPVGDFFSWFGK